jgi:hypothetical protein
MAPKAAKQPKRVLRASGEKKQSSHQPNDSQRKKVSNSKKQKNVEDDLESNKDEEDEENVLSETELGYEVGMNENGYEDEESNDDEESEKNGKDAGGSNSNPSSTSGLPGGVPGTIVARRGSTTSTPSIAASVSRLCDSAEITERVKELESMEKEHLALKARLMDLERKERVGNVVTPSKSIGRKTKSELNDDQKQMLTEVNYIMNTKVVRGVKFAKPGWNSYSTMPGTVCAMIMQDISLPAGTTEEEKKQIWDGFIKKALNSFPAMGLYISPLRPQASVFMA